MHQKASFEISKSAFGQFFKNFTIRGDPSDLGGIKISGKEKTGSEKEKKNLITNTNTTQTQKMGGISLMENFGLYGSPLLYSCNANSVHSSSPVPVQLQC